MQAWCTKLSPDPTVEKENRFLKVSSDPHTHAVVHMCFHSHHTLITTIIINDNLKSTIWLLWYLPSVFFCMLWRLQSQSSATLILHPDSMSSFSDFMSKWDHEISSFLYVAYSHFSLYLESVLLITITSGIDIKVKMYVGWGLRWETCIGAEAENMNHDF